MDHKFVFYLVCSYPFSKSTIWTIPRICAKWIHTNTKHSLTYFLKHLFVQTKPTGRYGSSPPFAPFAPKTKLETLPLFAGSSHSRLLVEHLLVFRLMSGQNHPKKIFPQNRSNLGFSVASFLKEKWHHVFGGRNFLWQLNMEHGT